MDEVDAMLGRPDSISRRNEGTLVVSTSTYRTGSTSRNGDGRASGGTAGRNHPVGWYRRSFSSASTFPAGSGTLRNCTPSTPLIP